VQGTFLTNVHNKRRPDNLARLGLYIVDLQQRDRHLVLACTARRPLTQPHAIAQIGDACLNLEGQKQEVSSSSCMLAGLLDIFTLGDQQQHQCRD